MHTLKTILTVTNFFLHLWPTCSLFFQPARRMHYAFYNTNEINIKCENFMLVKDLKTFIVQFWNWLLHHFCTNINNIQWWHKKPPPQKKSAFKACRHEWYQGRGHFALQKGKNITFWESCPLKCLAPFPRSWCGITTANMGDLLDLCFLSPSSKHAFKV